MISGGLCGKSTRRLHFGNENKKQSVLTVQKDAYATRSFESNEDATLRRHAEEFMHKHAWSAASKAKCNVADKKESDQVHLDQCSVDEVIALIEKVIDKGDGPFKKLQAHKAHILSLSTHLLLTDTFPVRDQGVVHPAGDGRQYADKDSQEGVYEATDSVAR